MSEKKVLELALIENAYKKKKNNNYNDFYILKNELFTTIDTIIELEFKKNISFKNSEQFIKDNMIDLIEIYININRHLKLQNNKYVFIRSIVDELINNVVFRCKNNINSDIKIIDYNKQEK